MYCATCIVFYSSAFNPRSLRCKLVLPLITIISISAEAFWKAIGKLSSNSLGIFKSVAKPLAEPAGIIKNYIYIFNDSATDFMVPSPPATMTLSGFNVSYNTLILAMSSIPVVVYNAKFNPLQKSEAASIISDLSIPPATGLTINIIFFSRFYFFY
jgi:hypothetical protein